MAKNTWILLEKQTYTITYANMDGFVNPAGSYGNLTLYAKWKVN